MVSSIFPPSFLQRLFASGKHHIARSRDVRISELWIHPVKGCRGQRVDSVRITRRGLENDRLFVVAKPRRRDPSTMIMVTQRTHAQMTRLLPSIQTCGQSSQSLHLRFSTMDGADNDRSLTIPIVDEIQAASSEITAHTIDIWGSKVRCIDQGDAAGAFLAELLDLPGARLLRMGSSARHTDPARTPPQFETNLSDAYPLLITSEASLEALQDGQAELGKVLPISMDRFRPNVVVQGCHPFEEDCWQTLSVEGAHSAQGGLHLHVSEPCSRCNVPDVDQASGFVSPGGVTGTLLQLRNGRQSAHHLNRFENPNSVSSHEFRTNETSTFFGVYAIVSLSADLATAKPAQLDEYEVRLHIGDRMLIDAL